MSNRHKSKQYDLIDIFNYTSRCLDDKNLNLRNIFLINTKRNFKKNYLNKANNSEKETSFLD